MPLRLHTPTREQFLESLVLVDANDIPSSQQSCRVCLSEYADEPTSPVHAWACTHIFHRQCLEDWTRRGNTCPLCRTRWCTRGVSDETVELETIELDDYDDGDVVELLTDVDLDAFSDIITRFNPTQYSLNNPDDVQELFRMFDELSSLTLTRRWTDELETIFEDFMEDVRSWLWRHDESGTESESEESNSSSQPSNGSSTSAQTTETRARDPLSLGYPRPAPGTRGLPQPQRTQPVSAAVPAARDRRVYPISAPLETMHDDDVARNLRVWQQQARSGTGAIEPSPRHEWLTIRGDCFEQSFASLVDAWVYRQGRWPDSEYCLLRRMLDRLEQWAWMHDGQVWQVGQIHDLFLDVAERVFVECGFGVTQGIYPVFMEIVSDAVGAMLCFRLAREIEVFGHLLPGPAYEMRDGVWGRVEGRTWRMLE